MSKTSVWFWFWLWQKSLNITKSTNVNICIYLGVWLSLLFIYSFASDGHQRPGIGCQFLKMVTSGNLATVTVESCFLFNISAWLQDFWTHKVNQHSFLTRRVCKHHFVLRVHLAMRKWPRCFLIFKEEKKYNYEIISPTSCRNISGKTSESVQRVTVTSSNAPKTNRKTQFSI